MSKHYGITKNKGKTKLKYAEIQQRHSRYIFYLCNKPVHFERAYFRFLWPKLCKFHTFVNHFRKQILHNKSDKSIPYRKLWNIRVDSKSEFQSFYVTF